MLCPVCATEMNNSPKCPFCGHVCSPDEDNTVMLNGEVISTGHRNHWCRTTDDKHLAGKMVDGTHYHPQDSHARDPYETGQAADGSKMTDSNMAGLFGQDISINGDLIPYNPNQGIPNQEITYTWSPKSGMQMHLPGAEGEAGRRKEYKATRWVLLIFLMIGWGLPFLIFIIGLIISVVGSMIAG